MLQDCVKAVETIIYLQKKYICSIAFMYQKSITLDCLTTQEKEPQSCENDQKLKFFCENL